MRNKKRVFSTEEVNYIVSNWGKESAHSMKKKLNCTWYAVCKVAEENGLELPTSNVWTEEQISTLKELADKYPYPEIAKMMNKTENAIYLKAKKLGIPLILTRKEWTDEEEEMLSVLWGNESIEYISKKMNRSIFSLKVRAVRMGLGPMIRNNYDLITVSEISSLLGVTHDRITGTWIKLGLKLEKIRLTKDKEYYAITLENLMIFLENNQDEWDSRNVELNIFGIEPEWLQEKRKRDIKEDPSWYRKWTDEEISKVEMLFNEGKNYVEISDIIRRSEGSVANLLREMGYSYSLPRYWKESELEFLRENYLKMEYSEIAEILGRSIKAVQAKAEGMGYKKRLEKRIIDMPNKILNEVMKLIDSNPNIEIEDIIVNEKISLLLGELFDNIQGSIKIEKIKELTEDAMLQAIFKAYLESKGIEVDGDLEAEKETLEILKLKNMMKN